MLRSDVIIHYVTYIHVYIYELYTL